MSEFLLHYKRPDPITWVYLSSFLTIGLFFVFHRFWSIRNFDLLLLIMLSPGLLMVYDGRRQSMQLAEWDAAFGFVNSSDQASPPASVDAPRTESAASQGEASRPLPSDADLAVRSLQAEKREQSQRRSERLQFRGFLWLLTIQALILLRLLLDCAMVRRPLLAPNLTVGGLFFIGTSMLVFLMANVLTSTARQQREHGPSLSRAGYPLMHALPTLPTRPDIDRHAAQSNLVSASDSAPPPATWRVVVARIIVITAHIAVLVGIVLIGFQHFGNLRAGAACSVLYLMVPYTAQMTGRVDHVLPAALLVWAVLMYRRPIFAGLFLGLAGSLVYYPLFLLPLWTSFYWQRGLRRFSLGVAITMMMMTALLLFGGLEQFGDRLRQMYGLWLPRSEQLEGVWGLGLLPVWRLPVLVAFVLLAWVFAIWPAQKNLGTLISCSAALMVAAQFWHGYGGGLYIAWFLPLLLLTIFRPNLEDRVALKVIGGGTTSRRRVPEMKIEAA